MYAIDLVIIIRIIINILFNASYCITKPLVPYLVLSFYVLLCYSVVGLNGLVIHIRLLLRNVRELMY